MDRLQVSADIGDTFGCRANFTFWVTATSTVNKYNPSCVSLTVLMMMERFASPCAFLGSASTGISAACKVALAKSSILFVVNPPGFKSTNWLMTKTPLKPNNDSFVSLRCNPARLLQTDVKQRQIMIRFFMCVCSGLTSSSVSLRERRASVQNG